MHSISALTGTIVRPKMLMGAARAVAKRSSWKTQPKKVDGATDTPPKTLTDLLHAEWEMEAARTRGDSAYRHQRHIEALAQLIVAIGCKMARDGTI